MRNRARLRMRQRPGVDLRPQVIAKGRADVLSLVVDMRRRVGGGDDHGHEFAGSLGRASGRGRPGREARRRQNCADLPTDFPKESAGAFMDSCEPLVLLCQIDEFPREFASDHF